MFNLCLIYLNQNKINELKNILLRIFNTDPNYRPQLVSSTLADIFYNEGDYINAIKYLIITYELDKQKIKILELLGKAFEKGNQE